MLIGQVDWTIVCNFTDVTCCPCAIRMSLDCSTCVIVLVLSRQLAQQSSHGTAGAPEVLDMIRPEFAQALQTDVTLSHPDAIPSDQPCWLPGMSTYSFLPLQTAAAIASLQVPSSKCSE